MAVHGAEIAYSLLDVTPDRHLEFLRTMMGTEPLANGFWAAAEGLFLTRADTCAVQGFLSFPAMRVAEEFELGCANLRRPEI